MEADPMKLDWHFLSRAKKLRRSFVCVVEAHSQFKYPRCVPFGWWHTHHISHIGVWKKKKEKKKKKTLVCKANFYGDGVWHDMDIPADLSAPIVQGIDQTGSNDFWLFGYVAMWLCGYQNKFQICNSSKFRNCKDPKVRYTGLLKISKKWGLRFPKSIFSKDVPWFVLVFFTYFS